MRPASTKPCGSSSAQPFGFFSALSPSPSCIWLGGFGRSFAAVAELGSLGASHEHNNSLLGIFETIKKASSSDICKNGFWAHGMLATVGLLGYGLTYIIVMPKVNANRWAFNNYIKTVTKYTIRGHAKRTI